MLTEKMKDILLYSLAEEYELYPEDHSKNSIQALVRRGFLEKEDDDYFEITAKGVKALGLPSSIRAKRPKTIVKKILSILSDWGDIEIISAKSIPAIAAEEDHYNDRTTWYDTQEALFATPYCGDEMEYVMAQIACDYAQKAGHTIYFERIRHLLIFYNEE